MFERLIKVAFVRCYVNQLVFSGVEGLVRNGRVGNWLGLNDAGYLVGIFLGVVVL